MNDPSDDVPVPISVDIEVSGAQLGARTELEVPVIDPEKLTATADPGVAQSKADANAAEATLL